MYEFKNVWMFKCMNWMYKYVNVWMNENTDV